MKRFWEISKVQKYPKLCPLGLRMGFLNIAKFEGVLFHQMRKNRKLRSAKNRFVSSSFIVKLSSIQRAPSRWSSDLWRNVQKVVHYVWALWLRREITSQCKRRTLFCWWKALNKKDSFFILLKNTPITRHIPVKWILITQRNVCFQYSTFIFPKFIDFSWLTFSFWKKWLLSVGTKQTSTVRVYSLIRNLCIFKKVNAKQKNHMLSFSKFQMLVFFFVHMFIWFNAGVAA